MTALCSRTLRVGKVWNLHRKQFKASLIGHHNWVRDTAISADDRLVISGSDDKTVKLWGLAPNSLVNTFFEHNGMVTSVDFHPDGTCIAAGSADSTVKVWDIRTNKMLQHYRVHGAAVDSVKFHPTGNFLLTASDAKTLKVNTPCLIKSVGIELADDGRPAPVAFLPGRPLQSAVAIAVAGRAWAHAS